MLGGWRLKRRIRQENEAEERAYQDDYTGPDEAQEWYDYDPDA